jgi:hypothetical protein
MDAELLMVIIGAATALVGGYYVARSSHETEPVRGDQTQHALHYVAAAATTGLPAAFWFALLVTIFTPANIFDAFVKYAVFSLLLILAALAALAVTEPEPAPASSNELPPPD